jgi:hypothetical protein
MKRKLAEKIMNDFPDMFIKIGRGANRETMIGNHIYCGDGWFDIIYNLCKEIYPMRPQIQQIKEKFGGLRFYASFPSDYSKQAWEIIRKAEEEASVTCEICGKKGERRVRNGWLSTECDECYKKRVEGKKET